MTIQVSKSRAAQEKLVQLEKGSAPFEDQLVEAANFIGIHVKSIGRNGLDKETLKGQSMPLLFCGKEEWLLKWLLKKLQAPKDDTPRYDQRAPLAPSTLSCLSLTCHEGNLHHHGSFLPT